MLTYVLLLVGFVILVKGADWLVAGASSLARVFGVSDLVIGLTIVAFGTSAPELVVSVIAAVTGQSEIAIGNVVGSNIANILLIIGVSAMVCPLFATGGTVWKEIPFMLLAAVVLAIQANDMVFEQDRSVSYLSRGDALVMLGFFLIFLYYTAQMAATQSKAAKEAGPIAPEGQIPRGRAIIMVVVGLAGLVLGGRWVVNGAVELATILGVSDRVIGLTVVAIGTSLPEMATSVVAAFRKNADIAVGNIVGSNIFNTLFVLGVGGTIAPLPFDAANNTDVIVSLAATVLLFLAMFTGKPRRQIQRAEGAFFVALYVGYLAFVILNP